MCKLTLRVAADMIVKVVKNITAKMQRSAEDRRQNAANEAPSGLLVAPQFGRGQVAEAAQALAAYQKMVTDAFAGVNSIGGAPAQVQVTFERPAESTMAVARRLESMLGQNGPKIMV